MSEELVAAPPSALALSVPWRDPQTVPREELALYITALEQTCLDYPRSADVRTMLGIAHVLNHDVENAMDTLQIAVELDPDSFIANYKFAELHFRLHALTRAEALTIKALNLATNNFQLAMARRQLQEIRRRMRSSARNLSWKMPILAPAMALSATLLVIAMVMLWK